MTTAAPASSDYRRQTTPRAALRELLEATLEWSGHSGPARGLVLDGARYRLTPLTAGAGGIAVLCECTGNAPIPEYPTRRRIRAEIGGASAPNLTIFTDTAHSALVWSWNARGGAGERVYRELSFRPGEAWGPLRPVLESIASAPAEVAAEPADAPGPASPAASVSELTAALADRIRASAAGEVDRSSDHAQAVQDAIDQAVGADGVRACWHALLRSRFVDPACGSGDWLEMALKAMVSAYEACLQRMDIELDDLGRRRPPARRDRLADFRRLAARAGGARRSELRRRFATELALLHNIFGADSDPSAVLRCRERLAADLEASEARRFPDLLSLNIIATCESRGAHAQPAGSDCSRAPTVEEVEVVHRAVATILRMHTDGALGLDEMARAMAAASRRLWDRNGTTIAPAEAVDARLWVNTVSWAGKGNSGLRITRDEARARP